MWPDSGECSRNVGILCTRVGGNLQGDPGESSKIGGISSPGPGVKLRSVRGFVLDPGLGSSQEQDIFPFALFTFH